MKTNLYPSGGPTYLAEEAMAEKSEPKLSQKLSPQPRYMLRRRSAGSLL